MVPKIETAEEFWDYYTKKSKQERSELEKWGRHPAPCNCGNELCIGWQMLHRDDRYNYGDGLNGESGECHA